MGYAIASRVIIHDEAAHKERGLVMLISASVQSLRVSTRRQLNVVWHAVDVKPRIRLAMLSEEW